MPVKFSKWAELSAAEREATLLRPGQQVNDGVTETVRQIISSVRENGDNALVELSRQLDGADLDALKVSAEELAAADSYLNTDQIAAIDLAINNVRKFHEAQLPRAISVETMPGVLCERLSHPLDAVGLYVPAGTAPLPSAAIMLAVPAAIANCPSKILCTPPRPDGTADPSVLIAAQRAGVSDIFKVGGAQAIAAMAFGTKSIPRVNKIFGPGNAWVTEAKSQVAADPLGAAIDMPAGPSEVLVIADKNANPEFVAADLLSQAEHGPDSQVLLLTPSLELAEQVSAELVVQIALLERQDIAEQSISCSTILLTDSISDAVEISNRYAPEHLILHIDKPRETLSAIRNAGSVFIGEWSPESVGDYCSGTNHVLPTYGYARSYSGLSVDQFMRQMTIQELTRDGLKLLGDTVIRLAELEGLDGHASAVQRRLDFMENSK
ncbi:MAG: histidinol dehydrogenase [Gammaproteobacteria bacterium]|nr:histidinol dehydrogenase [Gammaproteobacteria bacterium]